LANSAIPKKTVLIIGAGPAGLTAAHELIRNGRFQVIVCEASGDIGGISRTANYKGNRMDIGGHRFFSKSDWVMNWWRDILPVQPVGAEKVAEEKRILVRNRLSRIYYLRRFFDYPVSLSGKTIRNLGLVRMARIGASYWYAMAFPRMPERSLEDFLVNRFGNELYRTFFKDYTEKVWGVPCCEISAEWGAQRIKGLSVIKALKHALRKSMSRASDNQRETNTSLIEHFLYPKLGPGQLWEEVADRIRKSGGDIRLNTRVTGIHRDGPAVSNVSVQSTSDSETTRIRADYVVSTMPVKDLIAGMTPEPPANVCEVASLLPYRDFITVGLLLRSMKANPQSASVLANHCLPDNWIYIQESDVKLGRIQVFNNWSPYMVADPGKIWLGLEYFCQEGDDLWRKDAPSMTELAVAELEKIGLIDRADVLDSHVIKVPKTYPAYFGAYSRFDEIRQYTDGIPNLFLIGRNGMHRYNNQDHSMLTAKLAAEAISTESSGKDAIWAVNVDDDYHEE